MYDFGYQRVGSVEEAARLLAADPEAKLIAGGQTLIPVVKQRLNRPSTVIDLAGARLAGIKVDGNTVTIGAMTPHGAVAASQEVRRLIPALAELAGMIGDEQVRHRGTIGGSLANNDPAADYTAAVLALNATVRTQRREIKADDFFLGMFTTALEPDEIITAVTFPAPEKAAYEKFRNPASRYAMVGVFIAKTRDGVRVAVTGAGQNGVFRHTAMEQALASNLSPDAIANVTTPASEMNADIHGSAEYRAHLVGVMAKRALAKLR
jgi:aerobic carbon-monoxide dehydrogenase medium subunit